MKSLENRGFSDNFRGSGRLLVCLNLLNVRCESWQQFVRELAKLKDGG